MQPLSNLLTGCHPQGQQALDMLWQSLPNKPTVCWYPSAGNCFRDLLIWNHYRALTDTPEPDLYIHTDYASPGRTPNDHDDGRTRITLPVRYRLNVSPEIRYQVDPGHASMAGQAADTAIAELIHVRAESKTVGTIDKPVLYFHFENFNWFEQFVLERGLKLTHLFKLREGCGFGGARTSVSNLYPFLGQIGCRWLVGDQEVHINDRVMKRFLRKYAPDGPAPFTVQKRGSLGELSNMEVKAFEIRPGNGDDWLDQALNEITRGSMWEESSGRQRPRQSHKPGAQSAPGS
jgi:hypothetical protein